MELYEVNQDTTARYTGTIVDETGDAVPGSSLDSLSLTLTDVATGVVINSRSAQDVLGTNGVTVSEAGALAWTVDAEDNAMLDDDLEQETHLAWFIATWSSGQAVWGFHIRVARVHA